MSIDYQDNFKILRKINISGDDIFSLARLYLPLIGIDSFSLYFVLQSLSAKEIYLAKTIVDIVNLPKINDLEQALNKLEAIGLLKRYYSKDKGFALELFNPLKREEFFSSSILSEYLCGQIGQVEFEKLKNPSQGASVKGYKDVTKAFDEVYQTSMQDASNIYKTIINSKNIDRIKIKEVDFDYTLFKLTCEGEILSEEVLNDSNFKKNILEIAHTYHLNEEQMKEVIQTTFNIDKEMTFDYIAKNARNLYRKLSNKEAVKIETKESDNFLASSLDEDTFKFISYVENASFADVLKSLSTITPSVSELKMFDELKQNTNFSNGVINIMIIYVSEQLNGEIPPYNYFEKIANTWARANIKTSLDALNYTKDLMNRKNTPKGNRSNKKEVARPEWYNDYLNEVKKSKQDNQKLSDDEISKILSETDELF